MLSRLARICAVLLLAPLAPRPPAAAAESVTEPASGATIVARTPGPADEFKPVGSADEFGSLESTALPADKHDHAEFRGEAKAFRWVIGILFATIVAGLLVRFSVTRNLRAVFLTVSVAVLGFYKGACPCPIQSLQYSVLNLFGHAYKWQTLVYLLGLIPITYVFGRVFCGWICHMGAVQEFLFLGSRFRFLQSERAQVIMRRVRTMALVALVAQVVITQTNLYKKIDPFAVLYNFNSATLLGWILVAVLVVASVLLHRPFCKTLCPVGLILGWVSKIPGASLLGPSGQCLGCSVCNSVCRINAITRDDKRSILENQECIRCGECLEHCRKRSLTFFRCSRGHPGRVEMKCPSTPQTAPVTTANDTTPSTGATRRTPADLAPLPR
jgi:ferredoxin